MSSVDFECEMSVPVSPEQVRWFVAGKEVQPDDTHFIMKTDGVTVKLSIPSVFNVDAGDVCVKIGEKESASKLKVEGRNMYFLECLVYYY